MRDVFDPVEAIDNLLMKWWQIVLAAVIGGLLGLAVSFMQQPLYQAEAIFHASLDFTEINFENLVGEFGGPVVFTQFDEDLALQVVQRVLMAERREALAYAQTLDPQIDGQVFNNNMQIRRYLGQWYLRYRHPDPEIAQSIVNYWAEIGIQHLRKAQETGEAEKFVILSLVEEASKPEVPLYFHRNTLVLAGTLVGLFIGILVFDFRKRFIRPPAKEE